LRIGERRQRRHVVRVTRVTRVTRLTRVGQRVAGARWVRRLRMQQGIHRLHER